MWMSQDPEIELFSMPLQKLTTLKLLKSEVIEELSKSDDDGFTAIHLAARKNSHQVLREIFRCWKEQGYSMDSVLDFIKEENSTPLHVAVDGGNY